MYKLQTSRALDPRTHWRNEIQNWRLDIGFVLTGSMRRLLDAEMDELHKKGARHAQKKRDLHEVGLRIDGSRCWTLAEILGEQNDPVDQLAYSPERD